MQINLRTKYDIGDLVAVIPQRIAADRSGEQTLVGQVLSVRLEYRSPGSYLICYYLEIASSDGVEHPSVFEESVLEPLDEDHEK